MSRAILIALALCSPCFAQSESVEAFFHLGRTRLGGDEGSPGSATTLGGAVMVPLTEKLALDLDVHTGRVRRDDFPPQFFQVRRTLFLPALVRRARFGDTIYGFAGGGIGGQFDRTRSTFTAFAGDPPVPTGIVETSGTNSGFTLHGKAGVVASVTPSLLLRADVFLAFRYVQPNLGVRIGVGYRF